MKKPINTTLLCPKSSSKRKLYGICMFCGHSSVAERFIMRGRVLKLSLHVAHNNFSSHVTKKVVRHEGPKRSANG